MDLQTLQVSGWSRLGVRFPSVGSLTDAGWMRKAGGGAQRTRDEAGVTRPTYYVYTTRVPAKKKVIKGKEAKESEGKKERKRPEGF